MTRAHASWVLLVAGGSCFVWGCAASAPPSPSESEGASSTVAAIHARKCGSCHVAPEPGSRARPYVEAALARHEARLRLSRDEWAMMVDYIAAPDLPRATREDGATR